MLLCELLLFNIKIKCNSCTLHSFFLICTPILSHTHTAMICILCTTRTKPNTHPNMVNASNFNKLQQNEQKMVNRKTSEYKPKLMHQHVDLKLLENNVSNFVCMFRLKTGNYMVSVLAWQSAFFVYYFKKSIVRILRVYSIYACVQYFLWMYTFFFDNKYNWKSVVSRWIHATRKWRHNNFRWYIYEHTAYTCMKRRGNEYTFCCWFNWGLSFFLAL